MTGAPRPDVTLLLDLARAGDELARVDLIAQVYAELRRVAVSRMRREHPGHTLSPTASRQQYPMAGLRARGRFGLCLPGACAPVAYRQDLFPLTVAGAAPASHRLPV